MRGWLSAAIATFRDEPDVGAIGPLILGLGNNISDAGGTLDHEGNLGMPGRCVRASVRVHVHADSAVLAASTVQRIALPTLASQL